MKTVTGCNHARLHWYYPCDSCTAERNAEFARLRAVAEAARALRDNTYDGRNYNEIDDPLWHALGVALYALDVGGS